LVELLEKSKSLSEIPNTIPIKGSHNLFRIKTGNYRLIIERIKNGEIIILIIDYLLRNERTYKKR
jgi:mRNA-degrading endonuclease RelE of RelBE toxin-antitoxin system